MKNIESLLIDVLNILPEGVDCYIQAPSLEDEVVLSMMNDTEFNYYKIIKLDDITKEKFLERVKNYPISVYFQSIEIRLKNKLLFEGYDGVEFGIISYTIVLPEWFVAKNIKTKTCGVSNEW
jgi:hypothetical protein